MTDISEQYAQLKGQLPGAESAWLAPLRDAAMARFTELDFPTKRVEAWKYTDVRAIAKRPLLPVVETTASVSAADVADYLFKDICCGYLVFVDGVFNSDLSDFGGLGAGLRVQTLAEALAADSDSLQAYWQNEQPDAFSALGDALATDGVVIDVATKTSIEQPLQVLFVGTEVGESAAAHIKNIIMLQEGAELSIIETYAGLGEASYWHHSDTSIQVAQTARLEHYRLLQESEKGFHIGRVKVAQAEKSQYTQHAIQLSGQLLRSDVTIELNGPEAESVLDGLYIGSKRQHIDNHVYIRHMSPGANSNTLYKGAVGDRARGVFNGAIYVARDAQQTEAHLNNNNMLLSEHAEIDTKPELEIYADDVACSHGATVGQIEEESLHYLQSRGIDSALAKDILLFAFCSDVVSKLPNEAVKQRLLEQVLAKLPNGNRLDGVLG